MVDQLQHFEYEDPAGVHVMLEATFHKDHIYLSIEDPWCGDTETGFGAECHVDMRSDKAIEFAKAILRYYDND